MKERTGAGWVFGAAVLVAGLLAGERRAEAIVMAPRATLTVSTGFGCSGVAALSPTVTIARFGTSWHVILSSDSTQLTCVRPFQANSVITGAGSCDLTVATFSDAVVLKSHVLDPTTTRVTCSGNGVLSTSAPWVSTVPLDLTGSITAPGAFNVVTN